VAKNSLQLLDLTGRNVVPYLEDGAVCPKVLLLGSMRSKPRPDASFRSHPHIDDIEPPDPRAIIVQNIDAAHPAWKSINILDWHEFLTALEEPKWADARPDVHGPPFSPSNYN